MDSGTPAAEIVPPGRRARWLPGEWLTQQLGDGQADCALSADLAHLVASTIDEL